MRKQLLKVLLVTILLFCGCGQTTQNSETEHNEILDSTNKTVFSDIESNNADSISEDSNTEQNIFQYESVIHRITSSPITDTILVQTKDETDKYLLVDPDGNILYQFDAADDACGIFVKKEDGQKNIYRTIVDETGTYNIENISNLVVSENSEKIKILTGSTEPIIWICDVIESYDSYEYKLTAYNCNGEILNTWNESDFQTDIWGTTYNPSEIFEYMNIKHHGDTVYSIQTNNSDESFIICLDSSLVMPKGTTAYVNALNGKIFIDGICYDKTGNILWNNSELMHECILNNQHIENDLIGYLHDGSFVFINMNGDEMFRIPLTTQLANFDGYTANCPYAVFTYRNEGGTCYTTLYDRNGKMLFEPIKGSEYICNEDPIKLRQKGYLILDDGENIRLIDVNGDIVIEFERDPNRNDFAIAGNSLFQFCHTSEEIIIHELP